MWRIVWSDEAREYLAAAKDYIAEFSEGAARRFAIRVVDLTDSLETMPDRGRPVRPGVRELTSIRPYVIRYVVLEAEVRIMTIRHAAMKPEP